VSTLNEPEAQKKIREVLIRNNITSSLIERIVPSLEDVFIHLIAEEDANMNNTQGSFKVKTKIQLSD
jgi:hypothetical protein